MNYTKILDKEKRNALTPVAINAYFKRGFNKNIRVVDVQHVVMGEYSLNDLFTKDIKKYKCSINNNKGSYIKDVLILFIPVNSEFNGHYQMLCKKNNTIYFFDSYGNVYNSLLKKVNNSESTPVEINNNFAQLVLNSNLAIMSNVFPYQTNSTDDSTCGYHSSIVADYFLTNKDPDFNKYYEYISNTVNKDKFKTNFKYDYVVLDQFNEFVPEAVCNQ